MYSTVFFKKVNRNYVFFLKKSSLVTIIVLFHLIVVKCCDLADKLQEKNQSHKINTNVEKLSRLGVVIIITLV